MVNYNETVKTLKYDDLQLDFCFMHLIEYFDGLLDD